MENTKKIVETQIYETNENYEIVKFKCVKILMIILNVLFKQLHNITENRFRVYSTNISYDNRIILIMWVLILHLLQ